MNKSIYDFYLGICGHGRLVTSAWLYWIQNVLESVALPWSEWKQSVMETESDNWHRNEEMTVKWETNNYGVRNLRTKFVESVALR